MFTKEENALIENKIDLNQKLILLLHSEKGMNLFCKTELI